MRVVLYLASLAGVANGATPGVATGVQYQWVGTSCASGSNPNPGSDSLIFCNPESPMSIAATCSAGSCTKFVFPGVEDAPADQTCAISGNWEIATHGIAGVASSPDTQANIKTFMTDVMLGVANGHNCYPDDSAVGTQASPAGVVTDLAHLVRVAFGGGSTSCQQHFLTPSGSNAPIINDTTNAPGWSSTTFQCGSNAVASDGCWMRYKHNADSSLRSLLLAANGVAGSSDAGDQVLPEFFSLWSKTTGSSDYARLHSAPCGVDSTTALWVQQAEKTAAATDKPSDWGKVMYRLHERYSEDLELVAKNTAAIATNEVSYTTGVSKILVATDDAVGSRCYTGNWLYLVVQLGSGLEALDVALGHAGASAQGADYHSVCHRVTQLIDTATAGTWAATNELMTCNSGAVLANSAIEVGLWMSFSTRANLVLALRGLGKRTSADIVAATSLGPGGSIVWEKTRVEPVWTVVCHVREGIADGVPGDVNEYSTADTTAEWDYLGHLKFEISKGTDDQTDQSTTVWEAQDGNNYYGTSGYDGTVSTAAGAGSACEALLATNGIFYNYAADIAGCTSTAGRTSTVEVWFLDRFDIAAKPVRDFDLSGTAKPMLYHLVEQLKLASLSYDADLTAANFVANPKPISFRLPDRAEAKAEAHLPFVSFTIDGEKDPASATVTFGTFTDTSVATIGASIYTSSSLAATDDLCTQLYADVVSPNLSVCHGVSVSQVKIFYLPLVDSGDIDSTSYGEVQVAATPLLTEISNELRDMFLRRITSSADTISGTRVAADQYTGLYSMGAKSEYHTVTFNAAGAFTAGTPTSGVGVNWFSDASACAAFAMSAHSSPLTSSYTFLPEDARAAVIASASTLSSVNCESTGTTLVMYFLSQAMRDAALDSIKLLKGVANGDLFPEDATSGQTYRLVQVPKPTGYTGRGQTLDVPVDVYKFKAGKLAASAAWATAAAAGSTAISANFPGRVGLADTPCYTLGDHGAWCKDSGASTGESIFEVRYVGSPDDHCTMMEGACASDGFDLTDCVPAADACDPFVDDADMFKYGHGDRFTNLNTKMKSSHVTDGNDKIVPLEFVSDTTNPFVRVEGTFHFTAAPVATLIEPSATGSLVTADSVCNLVGAVSSTDILGCKQANTGNGSAITLFFRNAATARTAMRTVAERAGALGLDYITPVSLQVPKARSLWPSEDPEFEDSKNVFSVAVHATGGKDDSSKWGDITSKGFVPANSACGTINASLTAASVLEASQPIWCTAPTDCYSNCETTVIYLVEDPLSTQDPNTIVAWKEILQTTQYDDANTVSQQKFQLVSGNLYRMRWTFRLANTTPAPRRQLAIPTTIARGNAEAGSLAAALGSATKILSIQTDITDQSKVIADFGSKLHLLEVGVAFGTLSRVTYDGLLDLVPDGTFDHGSTILTPPIEMLVQVSGALDQNGDPTFSAASTGLHKSGSACALFSGKNVIYCQEEQRRRLETGISGTPTLKLLWVQGDSTDPMAHVYADFQTLQSTGGQKFAVQSIAGSPGIIVQYVVALPAVGTPPDTTTRAPLVLSDTGANDLANSACKEVGARATQSVTCVNTGVTSPAEGEMTLLYADGKTAIAGSRLIKASALPDGISMVLKSPVTIVISLGGAKKTQDASTSGAYNASGFCAALVAVATESPDFVGFVECSIDSAIAIGEDGEVKLHFLDDDAADDALAEFDTVKGVAAVAAFFTSATAAKVGGSTTTPAPGVTTTPAPGGEKGDGNSGSMRMVGGALLTIVGICCVLS